MRSTTGSTSSSKPAQPPSPTATSFLGIFFREKVTRRRSAAEHPSTQWATFHLRKRSPPGCTDQPVTSASASSWHAAVNDGFSPSSQRARAASSARIESKRNIVPISLVKLKQCNVVHNMHRKIPAATKACRRGRVQPRRRYEITSQRHQVMRSSLP